jgi:hypothetical protein
MAVRYNSSANAMLCQFENNGAAATVGTAAVAVAGCNNNWDMVSGGTRFQYNVTNSLYLGVEFLYQHFETATLNSGGTIGPTIATAFTQGVSALTPTKDENNLAVTARIHKDFLP